MNKIEEKMSKA